MYDAARKDTDIYSKLGKLGKLEEWKQIIYIFHHRRKATEPPDDHEVNLRQM
jgi:hypothetical protein